MKDVRRTKPSRRSRLFGWWYGSIAFGFLLLAVSSALRGAGWFGVALRLGIAFGFAALAWLELRRPGR